VIDPETDNHRAIRAYEKAGFRFVRAVPEDTEGGSVYLLELSRAGLASPAPEPEFHLRPAREGELALACAIDDDACTAFEEMGMRVNLGDDHPFTRAEVERWRQAIEEGRLLFACTRSGEPVGFAAFGYVDGRPYLHQVSVRRALSGKGIGRMLVDRVKRWAVRPGEVLLSTYEHVPWNGPWYQRMGFERVEPEELGPEARALFESERASVPDGGRRVMMRHRH